MLVELKGDVNAQDRWGGTPLSDAIREGHLDIAKILISCGGMLNMDATQAAGELCEYARAGEVDKMGMMLSGGCDQNSADYDARTCLHLAASEGNMHVVKVLIDRPGTDLNPRDRWVARLSQRLYDTRITRYADFLSSTAPSWGSTR